MWRNIAWNSTDSNLPEGSHKHEPGPYFKTASSSAVSVGGASASGHSQPASADQSLELVEAAESGARPAAAAVRHTGPTPAKGPPKFRARLSSISGALQHPKLTKRLFAGHSQQQQQQHEQETSSISAAPPVTLAASNRLAPVQITTTSIDSPTRRLSGQHSVNAGSEEEPRQVGVSSTASGRRLSQLFLPQTPSHLLAAGQNDPYLAVSNELLAPHLLGLYGGPPLVAGPGGQRASWADISLLGRLSNARLSIDSSLHASQTVRHSFDARSEQCNDQEHEDRPSCMQVMRKILSSLLLGLVIAICWVMIIHTLKWVTLRGAEPDLLASASTGPPQSHYHNHHHRHKAAMAQRPSANWPPPSPPLLHAGHPDSMGQLEASAHLDSSSGGAEPARLRAQEQPIVGDSGINESQDDDSSSSSDQQPAEQTAPAREVANNQYSPIEAQVQRERVKHVSSIAQQKPPMRPRIQPQMDDHLGPRSSHDNNNNNNHVLRAEQHHQQDHHHKLPDLVITRRPKPQMPQHPPEAPTNNEENYETPASDIATDMPTNEETRQPAEDTEAQMMPTGWQASPRLDSSEALALDQETGPTSAPSYRAPFFTSWSVSIWNILFMPVFTLISSCCFRGEDSATKKLLVRESISQFMDNGLTTLQFLGRCALFSVLWIGTICGIVYPLSHLDATVVMALFACSATLVYLLSWVLLHQQFVGVRIVAVIICTTGIALLAYMDNSRTLGSVLTVAGAALCAAVYKVIYQRMFGFWSIAQMSLFFTLIGLFNAFLMWPVALLLYFLGVEIIVWRYIPWMHLIAAGALHLTANIIAYFGPICTYEVFLTLGLLLAVILSAVIDLTYYKIVFTGMKLAGVLLLMIGFLVCLLPENWNEFLYDSVNERFIRWKKQRSLKKSRNKVQDLSTGQISRLRTPSGRVK